MVSSFPQPQHPGQDRSGNRQPRWHRGVFLRLKIVLETCQGATGLDAPSVPWGVGGQAVALGPRRLAPSSAPWRLSGGGVPAVFTPAPGSWPAAGEARAGGWPSWKAAEGPCARLGLWPRRADGDVKVADGAFFGRKGSHATGKPEGKANIMISVHPNKGMLGSSGGVGGPTPMASPPGLAQPPCPSSCSLGSLP